MEWLVLAPIAGLVVTYFSLRFGPKRCPGCRRFVFGYAGVPVGIRWIHFHCPRCGLRFTGHPRLPL